MDRFSFSKRIGYLFFTIIIVLKLLSICSFAGRIITIDNTLSYQTDDGSIAKNVWVWIDDNRDSIAECYRFNEDGLLAKNYVHYDGKMTNDKGQLLEDGVVVRKMTSTGRIITNEDIAYGPKDKDREEYLYGNVLIPKSIDKRLRQKIDDSWHLGSETLANDEIIDGEVIDNITGKYKPLSDVEAESGIIYNVGARNDVLINKDGEIIAGKNAVNFITSSLKFEKEVEKVTIYNGDKWQDCMMMKGNNSRVKFDLKKYNYMYFEITNQQHTNETYRKELDAVLSIYADGKLLEEIDDFTDGDPQVVELDLDNKKTLELKLTIRNGDISEKVYINNARFRKIKDEE